MSGPNRRRVERIKLSLTPAQAVVAWLEEVHQTDSMYEWAKPLAYISEEEHPFTVLMERATEAVTAGFKEKDWEAKGRARRQATEEVAFLYHLHL
ncbi:MAG: hypothetical protein O2895_00390, partial [Chloroflexi bacterium]|nr:hypothetical protein [Chloroflexota bacterium]